MFCEWVGPIIAYILSLPTCMYEHVANAVHIPADMFTSFQWLIVKWRKRVKTQSYAPEEF